jgi:acetylglutamate kinase
MTVVLKLGGRVAAEAARAVAELRATGEGVVVVHGAGPQITAELERRGIAPTFVAGRRVTTPDVLEVVRESFAEVNREVCAAIGDSAVPLWGHEIGLEARQVTDLGLVGDPEPSAPGEVRDVLAGGGVPVIVPLAVGPLNVNADEAAAALAIGLGAERILFVSDVPGVLVDGAVVESLSVPDAEERLADGRFEGGIVPKLEAAIRAVRGGVAATIGSTEVTGAAPSRDARDPRVATATTSGARA